MQGEGEHDTGYRIVTRKIPTEDGRLMIKGPSVITLERDEQAARALALLESVTGSSGEPGRRRVVPSSLGAGASGRTDVLERVDEVLAEGFAA